MKLIQSQRLTLAQLASATGCSPRTTRRDLAALEAAYFPIAKTGACYRLAGPI